MCSYQCVKSCVTALFIDIDYNKVLKFEYLKEKTVICDF